MDKKIQSLCYRCEYRAQFNELGHAPRCECGDVDSSKYSCYAFKPVLPILLKKDPKDKRPQFAGMLFSSRSHCSKIAEQNKDVFLNLKRFRSGSMLYWAPKEDK